jgi:putative copper export protein
MIKIHIMVDIKNSIIVILLITSITNAIFQIPNMAFAQQGFSDSGATESVTSTYDAIVKSILIISQVSILGITFNHVFFQKTLEKRYNKTYNEEKNFDKGNNQFLKRFTITLALCCITIIITSTGIMLIQSYELSQNLSQDLFSAFSILYATSVGQVWMIRITTSLVIMGLVFSHHIIKKITIKKKKIKDISTQQHGGKISNTIVRLLPLGIIAFSSINLFSNSMLSHSNSVSSLAVSIDWIHFMSVSIWIGGLFYLSTTLLKIIKSSTDESVKNIDDENDIKNSIMAFHQTSFSLMSFSFIPITSLCIIGTTGLYMSLIHLQSLNAIFTTLYGQILIIKLSLAFPMIFLGRHNQLKIQEYAALTSKLIIGSSSINNNNDPKAFSSHSKKRSVFFNSMNRSIKIESLIGISVLIAASFLSVTPPPSLETSNQDSNPNDNYNLTNNTNNVDLTMIVITLSIIIIIFGMVNFRKNRQQIRDIFPPFSG